MTPQHEDHAHGRGSGAVAGLVLRSLRSALAGPFDLEIAPGEIVIVRGPSGSGKTLFLRLIADLDPGEGEVSLHGRSRGSEAADAWRRRAIYVAAEPGWWAPDVAAHFGAETREEARGLASRLGLRGDAFEGPLAQLSTGERQRLALVRALVLKPAALLLDEPTAALDAEAAAHVEALLQERAGDGVILLLASHDAGQAERLGARILRIVERRLEPTS